MWVGHCDTHYALGLWNEIHVRRNAVAIGGNDRRKDFNILYKKYANIKAFRSAFQYAPQLLLSIWANEK